MRGPPATPVTLSPAQRAELEFAARSRTGAHSVVRRAQAVLLAADGHSNAEIGRRLRMDETTVRRWRDRYAASPALKSLADHGRSGRPPKVVPETRAQLISLACERPDDEHAPFRDVWSQKALQSALAAATGVLLSLSEIGRILRAREIRPHRVRMWLHSQDPEFQSKVQRVCALYVDPPPGKTVLCVDEKRLFAHRRVPGLRPARPNQPCRKEFEYSRHGSSVLLAAYDIRTGRVYGECRARRTADDLVEFMEAIAGRVSGDVIVIWDNLNVHFDGRDERWTRFNGRHGGRFEFVHTPKHASWVNQIEQWFSLLERRVLRHASFPTVESVHSRVLGFIEHWNGFEAKPRVWTFRGTRWRKPTALAGVDARSAHRFLDRHFAPARAA